MYDVYMFSVHFINFSWSGHDKALHYKKYFLLKQGKS